MKVGDLVQHKRHKEIYVVMELSGTAMVGIWVDNQVRWILDSWIKVINESEN